jgi:hypothetical protein
MGFVFPACFIMGLLAWIGMRFSGTYRRRTDLASVSPVIGMVAFMGGMLMTPFFADGVILNWHALYILPGCALIGVATIVAAGFAVLRMSSWVGRALDRIAQRTRDVVEDYRFHRELER